MTDTYWTADQCAADWGIAVKTWHGYVARNQAPQLARREGRTPLWLAATVRSEGADRPRAGQLGPLRLPVADVRHTINTGRDQAADESLPLEEREAAWRDASDAQRGLREALTDLVEAARERAEAQADREDREDLPEHERDQASDLRIAYVALAEDLRRAADAVRAYGIPKPSVDVL